MLTLEKLQHTVEDLSLAETVSWDSLELSAGSVRGNTQELEVALLL